MTALVAAGVTVFLAGPRLARARLAISVGLVLLLGVSTWMRAAVYRNEGALWADTVARNPGSSMACNSLGRVLANKPDRNSRGIRRSQTSLMQRAVELDEQNPRSARKPGHSAGRDGRLGRCGVAFSQGDRAAPKIRQGPTTTWGASTWTRGEFHKAAVHIKAALRVAPTFTMARIELARLYKQVGKPRVAQAHLNKILDAKPNSFAAHNNLGKLLLERGAVGRGDRAFSGSRAG